LTVYSLWPGMPCATLINKRLLFASTLSVSFAEETLSNTFDFAHKLLRMKEPQEFAQIQSEFVSRQAQLVGDQAKELGQRMIQGAQNAAQHAARSTHEAAAESSSRRRSEAA
jgi:Phasin protein